ncbi:MAG TPA: hypothetical protein PKD68_01510 [Candidatus Saccharibacteria bacterium]|nr:hypothetical protein [Candidatus Saccharibacteria bacterium]
MSVIVIDEEKLEKELRQLNAQGDYRETVKIAEAALDRICSVKGIRRFSNPAVTYQHITALMRLGHLEQAMQLRWSDMPEWKDFTPEMLGDWYRDGHARYFLSRGEIPAARGAMRDAMKLHQYGTSKYLLDELLLAQIFVAMNMADYAKGQIKAILDKLKKIDDQRRHEFASVERVARWWLLLTQSMTGDDDYAHSADWVADHDASYRRKKQAQQLLEALNKHRARLAKKFADKEIRAH